jgi:murein DD-endopeptidase MepM/ murein hydrolase activator NlpD
MAKSRNEYSYPVKMKKGIKISYKKSPAHRGRLKHSVDFIVPEGTPIYAALGGKVIFVRQGSNVGGPHRRYWFKGNRVVIRHKNGEYTAYEHLRYRGAKVRKGQAVGRGQVIGYSGNTGYSWLPHLHFEVFDNPAKDETEGITLQVVFRTPKAKKKK